MASKTDHVERTEAQQLEFNRRNDIAFALLPLAADVFDTRTILKERIAAAKKTAKSYWYWVIGIGGLVAHYAFTPSGTQFSAGMAVAIGTAVYWLMGGYHVGQLEVERARCQAKLLETEATWVAATGLTTFWEIERFVESGVIDRDDAFREWWRSQLEMIGDRVSSRPYSPPVFFTNAEPDVI